MGRLRPGLLWLNLGRTDHVGFVGVKSLSLPWIEGTGVSGVLAVVALEFGENQAKVKSAQTIQSTGTSSWVPPHNSTGQPTEIQSTISSLFDVLRMYVCPLDTVKEATAKPEAWMLAVSYTIWPECHAHGCSWCEKGSGKAKENHSLLYKTEGELYSRIHLIPGSASKLLLAYFLLRLASLLASHVALAWLEKLRCLCSWAEGL